MGDFLDRYGEQLAHAGRALKATSAGERPRRRWRSRRTAALMVAVVTIATPALAATQPWRPLLGRPALHDTPVGTSDSSPPSDQLAVLGVLRRAQDAQDRSHTARTLLANLGVEETGVRTQSIRLLISPGGDEAVLVSAEKTVNPAGDVTYANPLCLVFEHGGTCSSTKALLAGRFVVIAGNHEFGVVPDGITSVVLHYPGDQTRTAAVRENFFEVSDAPVITRSITAPGVSAQPLVVGMSPTVQWLDSTGNSIGPPFSR